MEDGYVLHTNPSWLAHHTKHNTGGRVAFMRGPNGSLARFRGGELLVFLVAGVNPHEIAGMATFVRNHTTSLGEAWTEYGDLLGAATFEDFLKIVPS